MKDIYRELSTYIGLSIQSARKRDKKGSKQFLKFAAEIFPIAFPSNHLPPQQQIERAFEEPLKILATPDNLLPFQSSDSDSERMKEYCWNLIHSLSGEYLVVLGEIYNALATLFQLSMQMECAVELAGRSLVTRIKSLGLYHERTGDAHFLLGQLYYTCGEVENSRKEFRICRAIRSKVFGEHSLVVATTDCEISKCEAVLSNFSSAYLSSYRCWRLRAALLGNAHPLVENSYADMLLKRGIFEERVVVALELKDRIHELCWVGSNDNLFLLIADRILSLNDESVLDMNGLKSFLWEILVTQDHKYLESDQTSFSTGEMESCRERVDAIARVLLIEPTITRQSLSKIDISGMASQLQQRQSAVAPSTGDDEELRSPSFRTRARALSDQSHIAIRSPAPSPILAAGTEISLAIEEMDLKLSEPAHIIEAAVIAPQNGKKSCVVIEKPKSVKSASIEQKTDRPTEPSKEVNEGVVQRRLSSISQEDFVLPFSIRPGQVILVRDVNGQAAMVQLSDVATLQRTAADNDEREGSMADKKAQLGGKLAALGIGKTSVRKASISRKKSLQSSVRIEASKLIPQPPPLPTTWPPIPYLGEPNAASLPPPPTTGMPNKNIESSEPVAKMKTIALDTLESVSGTMWSEMPTEGFVGADILFADMDEEFALAKKKPSKRASKIVSVKIEKKQESILDAKRTQNISIMLAKFGRRPISDIVQAVIDFDAEGLGISAATSLSLFVPTADDIATVNTFISKNPTAGAKLGKPEEYVLAMAKVSRVEQRLAALLSCLSVQDTVQSISSSAEAILKATAEVRGSARLKYLFKIILDLGNSLNQKAKRSPPVQGFKLSTLPKLLQVKSNSGETLLQYIVTRIHLQIPDALDLSGDMPSLQEARLVVFSRLSSDLKKMEDGIALMKSFPIEQETTLAAERLVTYLADTQKTYARAQSRLEEAVVDFKDLAAYVGEDGTILPEQLFGDLLSFIRSVETAAANASAKRKKISKMDLFKRMSVSHS